MTRRDDKENEPGPSGINAEKDLPEMVPSFSPEIVRPFSKALPRAKNVKRRVRKSAVLSLVPQKRTP